ncbi:MAG TPA: homoserine dehydrogenase [bacterium]|nr:homoserine dehydrogenase [bacterium]
MDAKEVKVGLFGFGTIGAGVVRALKANSDVIASKTGISLSLTKIVDIDTKTNRGVDFSPATLGSDASAIIEDPEVSIVVELIGGAGVARQIVSDCLKKGKHVVTANKELIAKHGPELSALARENGARLLFEASVGGGIPILHPLLSCLRGNKIKRALGIVNGTTNFILSQMAETGASFDDILAEAQARGYAEADPTNDVEGFDAAYKASILSTVAFGKHVDAASMFRQGITNVSREEMRFASGLGYVIKLLAVLEDRENGVDARVHPVLLPKNHPLAAVNNVLNAVYIEGEPIGPLMFVGEGAGPSATSSAVIGDIITVATEGNCPNAPDIFNKAELVPVCDVDNAFYIRMRVEDRPGVMAEISHCLGDKGVSIAQVAQDTIDGDKAEIVWLTHKVSEGNMMDALEQIEALGCVFSVLSVIRVFGTK